MAAPRRRLGEGRHPFRLPHLAVRRDLDPPAMLAEPCIGKAAARRSVGQLPCFQHGPAEITQGALLGVFTQSRQEIENAIEQVLNNQATPKEALTKTAGIVDAALTRYNQTAK